MSSNPYSPPEPTERGSVPHNWAVAMGTAAGIVAAVVLAVVTCVVTSTGVGALLFHIDGVQPVMAALVSMGLGLIAAFGTLVLVVRLTFRLLEHHSEE